MTGKIRFSRSGREFNQQILTAIHTENLQNTQKTKNTRKICNNKNNMEKHCNCTEKITFTC